MSMFRLFCQILIKSFLEQEEGSCLRVSDYRLEADLLLRHRDDHLGQWGGFILDFAEQPLRRSAVSSAA